MANDWTAVIPVKRLGAAKSRLRGAVPDAWHADLALAMVRDTVTAVRACAAVAELIVVTDDAAVARAVAALGARAVPDRPGAGLNAALRFGADVLAGLGRPRAVLAGDLPALRPAELADALTQADRGFADRAGETQADRAGKTQADRAGETQADRAGETQADRAGETQADRAGKARNRAGTRRVGRGFVRDAPGDGTVLLTAPAGVPLDPRFGADSAAAHAASGATELAGDWPGLRQDVDTPADLRVVLELGAGAHTCGLLRDIGRTAGCGSVAPAR